MLFSFYFKIHLHFPRVNVKQQTVFHIKKKLDAFSLKFLFYFWYSILSRDPNNILALLGGKWQNFKFAHLDVKSQFIKILTPRYYWQRQSVCRIRIRGIRIISLDPDLDPDPYQKMAGSGSVSNDADPDPTKTIENIK